MAKPEKKTPTTPDEVLAAATDVAAVWAPMGVLRAWDKNPRKNKHVVEEVFESIIRFGWGAVILARRENGEMVAGHTRYAAAELVVARYPRLTPKQKAKWHPDAVRTAERSEVPTRFGTWSEREAHLLAIADNKLNEKAEWDSAALAEELGNYSLSEAKVAGFDAKELSRMYDDLVDDAPDTDPKLGGLTFSVVVTCDDEQQQGDLLERLEAEGYACKPLVS